MFETPSIIAYSGLMVGDDSQFNTVTLGRFENKRYFSLTRTAVASGIFVSRQFRKGIFTCVIGIGAVHRLKGLVPQLEEICIGDEISTNFVSGCLHHFSKDKGETYGRCERELVSLFAF